MCKNSGFSCYNSVPQDGNILSFLFSWQLKMQSVQYRLTEPNGTCPLISVTHLLSQPAKESLSTMTEVYPQVTISCAVHLWIEALQYEALTWDFTEHVASLGRDETHKCKPSFSELCQFQAARVLRCINPCPEKVSHSPDHCKGKNLSKWEHAAPRLIPPNKIGR